MRRTVVSLLSGLLILGLSACGGGGEAADTATPQATAALSEAPSDSAESPTAPDAAPVDLPDGVAARIDGEDVAAEETNARAQALLDAAASSETPPQGDPETLLSQARAQVLSMTIQSRILVATAEDEGVPVTDEDVAGAREELAAGVGGEEELAAASGANGISEEALDEQLRGQAALTNLLAALAPSEAPASDAPASEPPTSDGSEPPGADLSDEPGLEAVQTLIAERLASTEVVVDQEYGTWAPSQGQVIPPGPPGGAPQGVPVPPAASEGAAPSEALPTPTG